MAAWSDATVVRSVDVTPESLTILTRSLYTDVAAAASEAGNSPANSLEADAEVMVVLPVAAAARSLSAF